MAQSSFALAVPQGFLARFPDDTIVDAAARGPALLFHAG
jgi:hypothetical protein